MSLRSTVATVSSQNHLFYSPLLAKRNYSTRCVGIITPDFIKRYDKFVSLSDEAKLTGLIIRALNILQEYPEVQNDLPKKKLNEIKSRFNNDQFLISLTKTKDLEKILLQLLPHIRIPVFGNPSKGISPAVNKWRTDPNFTIPLTGDAPPDHQLINDLLLAFLKERVSLIGAATWNSDETFRTLRYLGETKNPDFSIPCATNIEINPINARLAHLTACELGLGPNEFISIEGNALKSLPEPSKTIGEARQTIIACRLLPYLSFNETSQFLRLIYQHLTDTKGFAILTYPAVSITELTKPKTEFFQQYLQLCDAGIFEKKELKHNDQGEAIGISFYSKIDKPELGLIKDILYQTILFQEKTQKLLTELHNLKILKTQSIVGKDLIYREAVIVSKQKD